MTVDDVRLAVEEADRLGEQMLPGYKPSSIFVHEILGEAREHRDHDCNHGKLWRAVTTNRYFAALVYDEDVRTKIGESDWHKTGFGLELTGGLALHLFTGLVPAEEDQLEQVQDAFQNWCTMRAHEITEKLPDHLPADAAINALMWEGFLAGAMFHKTVEDLNAGPE